MYKKCRHNIKKLLHSVIVMEIHLFIHRPVFVLLISLNLLSLIRNMYLLATQLKSHESYLDKNNRELESQ